MPEPHHAIDDLENTPAGRTLLLTQAMEQLEKAIQKLTERFEELEKKLDGQGTDPGVLTRLALNEDRTRTHTGILVAIGTASLAGVWELIKNFVTK